MTLTWHIGGDTEPAADSWADLLPAGGIRETDRTITERDRADDPSTPIGAVYAAVRAGFRQVKDIAVATGIAPQEVGIRLMFLRNFGRVECEGRGRGARWRMPAP